MMAQTCLAMLRDFKRAATAPETRSMRQFAEQEIRIPGGPHAGKKFKVEYQPWTEHWFEALASDQFNRFVMTGCTQGGKTLGGTVIPLMWHIFERKETGILAAPKLEICEDKWLVDILPTIRKSRFADQLPTRGPGSQGGFSELITFRNGARLKSMTGGASDAGNAAFTAKFACYTEVDGMSEAGEASNESDPINRIAGRLRSFGWLARAYLECTVTIPGGRIWRELLAGTNSRLVLQCPHCLQWVTPEREHFVGWDVAATEIEAEQTGRFSCPDCGGLWSPEQRTVADSNARLIHQGQVIGSDGTITGPVPSTRTFSMRWSAVNNHFAKESLIANEEWKAARELDQENAQKQRFQQVWVQPWEGEAETVELTAETIASRLTGLARGICPDETETLVVQIDLHNHWHYWTLLATSPDRVRSVVDYGIHINPDPNSMGPKAAIRLGLEQLASQFDLQRFMRTVSGRQIEIDLLCIDAGYEEDIALEFVTSRPDRRRWHLTKGKGDDYRHPENRDSDTIPGDHWYKSRQPAKAESKNRPWGLAIAETNYWLRQVQSGFVALPFLPDGVTRRPGSVALFGTDPQTHLTPIDKTIARSSYALQILAWKWEEIVTQKRGLQMAWVSQYPQDHFLDTTYGGYVADSIARATLPRFRRIARPKPPEAIPTETPKLFRFLGPGKPPHLSRNGL